MCVFFTVSFILSFCFFFFNDTATTEIYTLSLHDALPIFTGRDLWPVSESRPFGSPCSSRCWPRPAWIPEGARRARGWPATGRSEEHTSELQSQSNLVCRLLLEKKKKKTRNKPSKQIT